TPVRRHRLHHLQKQLRRLHHRVLLHHLRQQRLQLLRRQRRQRVPVRRRLPLRHLQQQQPRQMQPLEGRPPCRPGRQPEERCGLFRRAAYPRCTPLHGITYIFFRRAASTSIRTCHPIVFFIERAGSVTHLRPTLCSLQVPTRHRTVGKSFLHSTRNVLSHI